MARSISLVKHLDLSEFLQSPLNSIYVVTKNAITQETIKATHTRNIHESVIYRLMRSSRNWIELDLSIDVANRFIIIHWAACILAQFNLCQWKKKAFALEVCRRPKEWEQFYVSEVSNHTNWLYGHISTRLNSRQLHGQWKWKEFFLWNYQCICIRIILMTAFFSFVIFKKWITCYWWKGISAAWLEMNGAIKENYLFGRGS